MRATRPHASVVCDNTEECTKLFHIFRCLYCENGFDFLWIWFGATRCDSMSKEVSVSCLEVANSKAKSEGIQIYCYK